MFEYLGIYEKYQIQQSHDKNRSLSATELFSSGGVCAWSEGAAPEASDLAEGRGQWGGGQVDLRVYNCDICGIRRGPTVLL